MTLPVLLLAFAATVENLLAFGTVLEVLPTSKSEFRLATTTTLLLCAIASQPSPVEYRKYELRC
jgi:hypothetical protein